jgi:hypothetical protein
MGAPLTGSAKQSIPSARKEWIASSLSLLGMTREVHGGTYTLKIVSPSISNTRKITTKT